MRVYTEIESSENELFPSANSRMPIRIVRQAFLRRGRRGGDRGSRESPKGNGPSEPFPFGRKRGRKSGVSDLKCFPSSWLREGSPFPKNKLIFDVLFSRCLPPCIGKRKAAFRKMKTDSRYSGWFETDGRCYLLKKQSVLREDARLDPVFVFAKGFGSIEGGRPVFFRGAARKKGSKQGRRALFGGEVLYNVLSLAGL